jgi:hypothetical protein
MDIIEADKYPKFKDYDFTAHLKHGGSCTLLIQNTSLGPHSWKGSDDAYILKRYGLGSLQIMPYLQPYMNAGKYVSADEIAKKLSGFAKKCLFGTVIDRNTRQLVLGQESQLLYEVIKNFRDDGLIKVEQIFTSDGRPSISDVIISHKDNWDEARVFEVTKCETPSSKLLSDSWWRSLFHPLNKMTW